MMILNYFHMHFQYTEYLFSNNIMLQFMTYKKKDCHRARQAGRSTSAKNLTCFDCLCQGFTSRTPARVRDGSLPKGLTNILLSYLVSDSFGPMLGARAWSCKTTNDYLGLSQLRNTSETFGERCLRLPPGLLIFYIVFLLYGLMGLTILDHIYSSFL